mmetsp:Transcript_25384/g.57937  ORF Transcript_25384/g.57937 Transcript_25384/m.57937 type:complete len:201 (-) Transcript_25384:593-1195(-)
MLCSIVISLLVLLMSRIIATARAGGALHAATCRTVPPSRGCGMESWAATSPAGWDRRSDTREWRSSQELVARARWRGDRDERSSGSPARDDVRSDEGPAGACGRAEAVREGLEAEEDFASAGRTGDRCELMADAMESTPPPPLLPPDPSSSGSSAATTSPRRYPPDDRCLTFWGGNIIDTSGDVVHKSCNNGPVCSAQRR